MTQPNEKEWEKIVDDIFAKRDDVVVVSTRTKKEYLHLVEPEYIRSYLDEKGNVQRKIIPEKYETSENVSEGAIDEREVTVIAKEYRQSDIIKQLIKDLLSHQRESIREEIRKKVFKYCKDNGQIMWCKTEEILSLLNKGQKENNK